MFLGNSPTFVEHIQYLNMKDIFIYPLELK